MLYVCASYQHDRNGSSMRVCHLPDSNWSGNDVGWRCIVIDVLEILATEAKVLERQFAK